MGAVQVILSRQYSKVVKYHVWDTVTSSTLDGGKQVAAFKLTFADYKFDDEVKIDKS